jgi:hypothetical protein
VGFDNSVEPFEGLNARNKEHEVRI